MKKQKIALSEIKTEILDKKTLNTLKFEKYKTGFIIWVRQGTKRYWIIDASCLFEDGKMSLGHSGGNEMFIDGQYKYSAKFNPITNDVELVRKIKDTKKSKKK